MKDVNNLGLTDTASCIEFVREHLTTIDETLDSLLHHEVINNKITFIIKMKVGDLEQDRDLLMNEINLLTSNHAFADIQALENIMADLASYTKSAQGIIKDLRTLIED